MDEYKVSKTVAKGGTTAGTITVAGLAGGVIAYKLQPILSANGVSVDTTVLALVVTGLLQSAYVMASNFIKHKVLKK